MRACAQTSRDEHLLLAVLALLLLDLGFLLPWQLVDPVTCTSWQLTSIPIVEVSATAIPNIINICTTTVPHSTFACHVILSALKERRLPSRRISSGYRVPLRTPDPDDFQKYNWNFLIRRHICDKIFMNIIC